MTLWGFGPVLKENILGSKVTIEMSPQQLSALLDYIERAEDHDIFLTSLQRSAKAELEEVYNQEVIRGSI